MRFEHILFASDFSEYSGALTGELGWLANRFHSKVTLMHVLEVPVVWYAGLDLGYSMLESLEDLNTAATKRLSQVTLHLPEERVRRVVGRGDVAAEIADYVTRHQVDLIIMGTHGRGPVGSLLCGSVLAKLLHDVDCPVWTAAYSEGLCRCRPVISKMVCGLELTEEAIPLLRTVSSLADSFNAQVRIVHVVPGPETRPNKYFDFDLHQYLMEAARVEIGKLQRQAGTEFPVTVGSASIAKELADAAVGYECDLVVIGRGKARAALGRVRTHAYDIVRQAPCPVLSCAVGQESAVSDTEQPYFEQVGEHAAQYARSAGSA